MLPEVDSQWWETKESMKLLDGHIGATHRAVQTLPCRRDLKGGSIGRVPCIALRCKAPNCASNREATGLLGFMGLILQVVSNA